MSFAFNSAGSPDHVEEQVERQTRATLASPQSPEQDVVVRSCIEAVKGVARAVRTTPGGASMSVECSGHVAPSSNYGNVDLRVRIWNTFPE